MGKKRQHYFRMVVADQRAKRDGAFLETLGSYDPHANPPSITLNEESAREWIRKGAQPSEAAEKILRRAGIIEGGSAQRPQVEPTTTAVVEPPKAEAAAAETPPEGPAATETPDAEPTAEAAAESEESTKE